MKRNIYRINIYIIYNICKKDDLISSKDWRLIFFNIEKLILNSYVLVIA